MEEQPIHGLEIELDALGLLPRNDLVCMILSCILHVLKLLLAS